jgi:hypothetical protein
VCEMLDNVCDINRGIFSGWFQYWLSSSCPLKIQLQTVPGACHLVNLPGQLQRAQKWNHQHVFITSLLMQQSFSLKQYPNPTK